MSQLSEQESEDVGPVLAPVAPDANREAVPGESPVGWEWVTSAAGPCVVVTLNRATSRNPIDASTLNALEILLTKLAEETSPPRAVIITGAGSAFSAGGDLKKYRKLFADPAAFEDFMASFRRVCEFLERMAAITVAMINGACVAGGLELALACDVIVMAETARIGDGHLRFGQLPGAGSSQRLVRAIGVQRARYWLLSGRLFTAAEAVEVGLALEAVPDDRLRSRTLDLVSELMVNSPLAIAEMKLLIRAASTETLEGGLDIESEAALRYATQSYDATEGLNAFAEHRQPRFLGR
jgi:enoyl-CoA hydratase/carnithine racemase